jgi:hypothetical protein
MVAAASSSLNPSATAAVALVPLREEVLSSSKKMGLP